MKNIPVTTERSYLLKLIEQIEMVVKRMRLRVLYCDMKGNTNKTETYGLKSLKTPPPIKELAAFENDLIELVRNIKLRIVQNWPQRTLKSDIKLIQQSSKIRIAADKTSNMDRLTKEEYNKMRRNAITSTYTKTDGNIKKRINEKGKEIVIKSFDNILDRMDVNTQSNCFIIIKDHKENFLNHPRLRLINPAKNELTRISKTIFDNINMKLFETTKINHWINTVRAIKWFNSLNEEHLMKFAMFDIKGFYPFITQDLLNKALNFASEYIRILKSDIDVMHHSRKSLLFDGSHTWIKKEGGLFDGSMGSYDRAEVCKLVGRYILNLLSRKYNKNDFGLYRDDGLAVLKNNSGPQSEQVKENIQKILKGHGLDIIIKCNMKIVNYLDATFHLNDETYKPYTKPNNEIK